MEFAHSPQVQELLARLGAFMRDEVLPAEATYRAQATASGHDGPDWQQWRQPPVMEALKARARALGLWNLFLPDPHHGAGLRHAEYAPLAELMGHAPWAAEVFNCSAPDTGNMEVLHLYGSPEQQARWLAPLLAGEIRSAFCMTEPAVASSDATNMQATAVVQGDEVVLNGRKWWSTGIGHPHCRVLIFMGLSDPGAEKHRRHAMVLVPLDTPGVKIERMLPAFGMYDAPSGHGEVSFTDVRVPLANVIAGLGRGFEIAQGRLGPGRIHHCMRVIGAAERALALACARAQERVAFGKPLAALGGNLGVIANARMAIEQARLLTLQAAWMMDTVGVKAAMSEISQIKVVAPNMAQQVIDAAIQLHGGAGVSDDVPLTALAAYARVLRIADGPDEVHRELIGKLELKRQRQAPPAPAQPQPAEGVPASPNATAAVPTPAAQALIDQGGPVREGEALNLPRVDAYLQAHLPGLGGLPEVTQFPGGASNLTYRLRYPGRDLILRRPPFGHKAKSAHDMAREARVMARLRPVYPWVPQVLAVCEDPTVLGGEGAGPGSEFYVMERLVGIIPRRDLPPELGLAPAQVRQLCLNVIDKLIALHQVDVPAAGLADLGRGEGYVRRQVEGWSQRYRAARTDDVADFEAVMAWLAAKQPEREVAHCLIHNDFRFDNVVLHPERPLEVIGVLDWEMATVGDPLMDLGNTLAYWVQADDDADFQRTRRQPTHTPGMLTREEVIAYYAERTGWSVARFDFYALCGLFRLAVIVQQIYRRYRDGATRNPQFAGFGAVVNSLAQRCQRLIAASAL